MTDRSPTDTQPIPNCCGYRNVGVDVHAHYFPESYLRLLETEGGPFSVHFEVAAEGPTVRVGSFFVGPIQSMFVNLDERLEAMDRQGIAAQALSLTQPMVYWASDDLSRRLSAVFNDALAVAHEAYPSRFFGLAILPMQDSKLAIAELDRVAMLPGVRGIYMATRVLDRDLSDLTLWPVYERIQDLGLPIFLHPLDVIGMTNRLAEFFLSNLLGNPFDTAIAASHLIFGGVLDRFPRLNFVLPHGGGALPFLIGRIEHGWRVRPECRHLERSPRDYLTRFHYDTITHSAEALDFLINLVGPGRVLLGSDYCFDMGCDQPVEVVVNHPNLTDADRHQILFGNAERLLRMFPGGKAESDVGHTRELKSAVAEGPTNTSLISAAGQPQGK